MYNRYVPEGNRHSGILMDDGLQCTELITEKADPAADPVREASLPLPDLKGVLSKLGWDPGDILLLLILLLLLWESDDPESVLVLGLSFLL